MLGVLCVAGGEAVAGVQGEGCGGQRPAAGNLLKRYRSLRSAATGGSQEFVPYEKMHFVARLFFSRQKPVVSTLSNKDQEMGLHRP